MVDNNNKLTIGNSHQFSHLQHGYRGSVISSNKTVSCAKISIPPPYLALSCLAATGGKNYQQHQHADAFQLNKQ